MISGTPHWNNLYNCLCMDPPGVVQVTDTAALYSGTGVIYLVFIFKVRELGACWVVHEKWLIAKNRLETLGKAREIQNKCNGKLPQWSSSYDSTPNSGSLGLIPGWGTRTYMLQPRVPMPQLKIPHASTKTQCSQNKQTKNQCNGGIWLFI